MKITLAALAASFVLAGCENNFKPTYSPIPAPVPSPTPWVCPEPTEAQKKASKIASDEYFNALLDTINEIDDGTTSPEIIARVAVEKNLDLLRKMAGAKTAHIAGSSYLARRSNESLIQKLPTNAQINVATYLVLGARKEKSASSSKP